MPPPSLTRRHFLAASAALPFAVRSFAEPPAPRWVFLGNGGDKGIYRSSWNPSTGALSNIQLAAPTNRPNFLALHPSLPVLYCVNEDTGSAAGVSSFHLDRTRGALTQTSRLSSHGDGACYISIDHTGRTAFSAEYAGGTFSAFDLGPTGALANFAGGLDCRNNPVCGALGPVHDRQDAAHMHCAVVSPHNDFVLACNLGEDAIEVFPINPGATYPLGTPHHIAARAGSGPRHVAFHPNRRWLYCIHELDCTVDLYDWAPGQHFNSESEQIPMHLRPGSAVSTLAPGVALTGNTACELIVSDDGRFLTTCTRGPGSNSITIYAIDPSTGLLSEHQRLSCGGDIPRYIAFDPSRRWLLCTNQGSNTVTVFAHDPVNGHLHTKPQTFPAEIPMFALFV